jgi:hypothetical protein
MPPHRSIDPSMEIHTVDGKTGLVGIVTGWEAAELWYAAARNHMKEAEAAAKIHRRRKFISSTNLAIEALTHANKNIEALLPR